MSINICEELHQNFIDFAYEANSQRAFPSALDGLKPGQRACLWEFFSKGYTSNKPHVKSAKVSGGVIAETWPHSNSAIYETFCRMSQDWINNVPEVDWHGSNGSIQISGEGASERYTEARLSQAAELGLFQGIKKNNVPMILNFSEDKKWPEVLPAVLPRLLVNGSQGIGLTIANHWTLFNLNDCIRIIEEYIQTSKIDYNNFYPDYPTGGIIINKNDIHTIHETGRGKVILRAKAEIKDNIISITEIPYQTYVEPIIDEIKNLIVKEGFTGIDEIFNKSDRKRLLIEIHCDENPEKVLNKLFAQTNLQKSYNPNQFALVGKTPRLLTLKEYLNVYIQHNYDCIKREFQFDLEKSQKRKEIIDGLLKALENIDNIIALIKKSDDSNSAQKNLITQYNFTESQAKAIVSMRLGTLAHLESIELNKENQELEQTINNCKDIISSESKRSEIFLTRLKELGKKFGHPRRTQVEQLNIPKEEKVKEEVIPEKCVVVMTEGGKIKRVPIDSFKIQKKNTKGIKAQDDITSCIIRTSTADSLMIFSTKGVMYRINVGDIPNGTNSSVGQSVKILTKMAIDEEPATIYSIYHDTDAKYVLFATKKGTVKKTAIEEYINTKKSGVVAIKLREGDSLAAATLIKDEDIFLITKNGQTIRFNSSEITPGSRNTIGLKGITLSDGDEVISCLPIRDKKDDLAVFGADGRGRRFKLDSLPIQARGGKGSKLAKDSGPRIAAAVLVNDDDNVLIVGNKNSVCISAKDIPVLEAHQSVGNILIKADYVKSATKV